MNAVDIINKKRNGEELSRAEIRYFINGFTRGEIPDYQASAWAMAVVFQDMTDQETTELTLAMAESGETLDMTKVLPIVLDKHSTGGVGDKTTLVIGPIVAACGLPIGKMSGRGLGFSGGTLDKLESIPGYRTQLTTDEFLTQLKEIGLVVCGQTADLAPADGKLYALRDVTGTVQSIPLIASSIMSKKIAAGAQAMVLDVKVGHGAFMKDIAGARRLGELMVVIAKQTGRKAVALISDMNQPLGNAVGNSLEVAEAIQTLKGNGPEDFTEHCLLVSGYLLYLGKMAKNAPEGKEIAMRAIREKKAWEKFLEWIERQGGDIDFILHPEKLAISSIRHIIEARESGYLEEINAQMVGEASVDIGAGRHKKGDAIDPSVGMLVHHKVGDQVQVGEPLMTVYAKSDEAFLNVRNKLNEGIKIIKNPVKHLPLFYGTIPDH